MQQKPRLSFWQIWNMSFGFMGIQFGWGLQLANMSGIYTYLGARPEEVPILWLAGPVTGLLVQPIVGSMSDRTWNRLGRRRPYFLVGAILASIALFFMPDSPVLWMAAGLLWILDASINVSMEPFRAFVADKLNTDQRTAGFVMQSFFIGVGQSLANLLPYIFRSMGVDERRAGAADAAVRAIPASVNYAFKIGAVAFLICVLWTVFTTKEYPPEDMEEFMRKKELAKAEGGFMNYIRRAISIEQSNYRSVGKLIAAAAALFVLVAYFLPWVGVRGSEVTYSGYALSANRPPTLANVFHNSSLLYLIPAAALITLIVMALCALSREFHNRIASFAMFVPIGAGLITLALTVYQFVNGWNSDFTFQFGIIACLAGSLILAFGWVTGQSEVYTAIREMPTTMKQLAVVQFFTWLGLFCMWMFFGLMTSYHVFGAANERDPLFTDGQAWGGNAFAVYSITCFAIAFLLPPLARATSRKTVHAVSLVCGGIGLLSAYFIQDRYLLLLTMVGVGVAWASILSMPYAILAGALPPTRMGVYMGVFNFFIVIPEIIASFTFGPAIRALFGRDNPNAPLYVVMAGGAFLLVAAACVSLVRDTADDDVPTRAVIRGDEHEPLTTQGTAQPVPSTGLVDDGR